VIYKIIRITSALSKATIAIISKPLLFKIASVGEQTDALYATVAIAGTAFTIFTTLTRPAFYNLIAFNSNDKRLLRNCISEALGVLILSFLPVVIVGLAIAIGYCSGKSSEATTSFLILYGAACFSAAIDSAIFYIIMYLRILGDNFLGDLLILSSQVLSSLAPLALVKSYGVIGYSVSSALLVTLFGFCLIFLLRITPHFPSCKTKAELRRASKPMLGPALFTKLYPLLEAYLVQRTGSGFLTLYSFAKGVYASLLSFLDISILQRFNASSQALIGKHEFQRLSVSLRDALEKLLLIALLSIPLILFSKPLILILASYIGFDSIGHHGLLYSIALALYPFAIASIVSSLVVPLLYMLGLYRLVSSIAISSCAISACVMYAFCHFFGVIGVAISLSLYFAANVSIFTRCAFNKLSNSNFEVAR
jgi:hypothetical protein